MCTTAIDLLLSKWGCEFSFEGLPCVAHLVCAIPTVPSSLSIPSKFANVFTLPLFFITTISLFSIVAIPAESYPLYSSLNSPLINIGVAFYKQNKQKLQTIIYYN